MTLATGGTVTEAGGYRLHTFASSADLVVTVAGAVEVALVGGGAGAGRNSATTQPAGGGGGGAVKTGTPTLSVGTYPVVIGGGGAGYQIDGNNGNGSPGTASTFNGVTAGGGGYGGRNTVAGGNAADGGGAGGGGGGTAGAAGAGGISTGGFNGGAGFGSATGTTRAGGGGGGAGAIGVSAVSDVGGNGGAGVSSSLSGVATFYGGGGGGACNAGDTVGAGGSGGGMAGTAQGAVGYPNAAANTGGGGGGAGFTAGSGGGNGGSGLALVRYPAALTLTDAGDELYLNGDAVTLTGTNFLAAQGGGTVKLSPTDSVADGAAVAQTVTGWADTSIGITVVAGALTKGVTLYLFVTNNLGESNAAGRAVVLVATPVTITDAGDELYADGEAFTITGTHYLANQGAGRVVISPADDIDDAGAVVQTVNSWAATSIAALAVKGSLAAGVALYLFVENDHGVSNAAGFPVEFEAGAVVISDAGDELYLDADAVTITGANFLTVQGAGRVVISPTDNVNDGAAVEQTVDTWGASSIEVTIEQGALAAGVALWLFVENHQGASNATGRPVEFLAAAPVITDAGDESYDAGDPVTITGTGFLTTQGALGRVYISPTNNVNDGGRVQQTVTTWAPTSIGITVAQGALIPVVTHYLFVRNHQGTANATGFAVIFEGEPIPPTPEVGGEGWRFIEGIDYIEPIE